SDELKQPSARWYSAVLHSDWAFFEGDFARAEEIAEEALHLGEHAQSWDANFSYRITLLSVRREQGRLAEVEDLLRQSVDDYPGYQSFRCLLPVLEWELGREDAARRA